MDHRKQQSSSSSFTENLFGPTKDASSSSSSAGLFSSVFGPSSTGLGRDSSHAAKNTGGSSRNQEYGGPYGSGKASSADYNTQRNMAQKEGNNPVYQNETAEPSYLSSSIYYGGQEVYSPNTQTSRPHHTFKKDGGDEDSSASRGNWWQGSLYY